MTGYLRLAVDFLRVVVRFLAAAFFLVLRLVVAFLRVVAFFLVVFLAAAFFFGDFFAAFFLVVFFAAAFFFGASHSCLRVSRYCYAFEPQRHNECISISLVELVAVTKTNFFGNSS